MAKGTSRPKQWSEACGKARAAFDALTSAAEEMREALDELNAVRDDYESWRDNLPENLQQSALGEKLDTVCDMDFEGGADEVQSAIDSLDSLISEAEEADLPLGFGRD